MRAGLCQSAAGNQCWSLESAAKAGWAMACHGWRSGLLFLVGTAVSVLSSGPGASLVLSSF